MNANRTMTTVRLPRQILSSLKARAVQEGKSLNRLFLELAEDHLKEAPPRKHPKPDPLFLIGTDPWQDGPSDLSVRHDEYLYGPATYRVSKKA